METREAYRHLHVELKELAVKIDQLNEQITIMRIEIGVHREKFRAVSKFHSGVWGVIGGAIAAAAVAIIDFLFRK